MVNEHVQKMLILCLYGNRVKMTSPTGTGTTNSKDSSKCWRGYRESGTVHSKMLQFPRKRTRQELKSL